MYVRPISTRLLRGMLTPEIRAIWLSLSLLVPWIGADDQHPPVTADDLALLAHRLDRRSYFHAGLLFLFENLGGGSFVEALETGTVAATSPRSTCSAKWPRYRRTGGC